MDVAGAFPKFPGLVDYGGRCGGTGNQYMGGFPPTLGRPDFQLNMVSAIPDTLAILAIGRSDKEALGIPLPFSLPNGCGLLVSPDSIRWTTTDSRDPPAVMPPTVEPPAGGLVVSHTVSQPAFDGSLENELKKVVDQHNRAIGEAFTALASQLENNHRDTADNLKKRGPQAWAALAEFCETFGDVIGGSTRELAAALGAFVLKHTRRPDIRGKEAQELTNGFLSDSLKEFQALERRFQLGLTDDSKTDTAPGGEMEAAIRMRMQSALKVLPETHERAVDQAHDLVYGGECDDLAAKKVSDTVKLAAAKLTTSWTNGLQESYDYANEAVGPQRKLPVREGLVRIALSPVAAMLAWGILVFVNEIAGAPIPLPILMYTTMLGIPAAVIGDFLKESKRYRAAWKDMPMREIEFDDRLATAKNALAGKATPKPETA